MKSFILFFFALKSTAFALAPSVFEDSYKWKKTSVSVCWGTVEDFKKVNPDIAENVEKRKISLLKARHLEAIQKKVQAEYTTEKTGIEFTGWTACSENPKADIVMLAVNRYKEPAQNKKESDHIILGEANIGISVLGFNKPRTGQGSLFLSKSSGSDKITSQEELLMTALHEFGHAAGLRHEHIRPEAQEDKHCKHRYHGRKFPQEELKTASVIGSYDPRSIMNYCYDWYVSDKAIIESKADIQLSPQDRQTLLCMYAPEQAAQGSCDKILAVEKFK